MKLEDKLFTACRQWATKTNSSLRLENESQRLVAVFTHDDINYVKSNRLYIMWFPATFLCEGGGGGEQTSNVTQSYFVVVIFLLLSDLILVGEQKSRERGGEQLEAVRIINFNNKANIASKLCSSPIFQAFFFILDLKCKVEAEASRKRRDIEDGKDSFFSHVFSGSYK